MRKTSFVFLALLLCVVLTIVSFAHSGKTDSNGGHYDRSSGEYHYHHGYSAHDHYDMDGDGDKDCPYTFKKTQTNKTETTKRTETTTSRLDSLFNKETNAQNNTADFSSKKEVSAGKITSIVLQIIFFSIFTFVFLTAILITIYEVLGAVTRFLSEKVFQKENTVAYIIVVVIGALASVIIISVITLKSEGII